ncbi:hypothetical protein QJ857_gp0135 [Tupanvirus soda lake]|uniref:Uncharacterized protein n=2 Tax=Tupanvirus TaxID=2094720 RepID=A0A6N1NNG7_9VIRU|nr:hypothetical protein QJ857_gp0135 [Tupanvirus soda lake]QKU35889.1 hypothetical protein [Tupanvirus soda lake]
MSDLDKNVKQVNGPINVVRMEGKIGDIEKVIYLFLDQHNSITNQMECDNIFSKDASTFFAESFSNLNDSDRVYDFFLELMPSKIQNVSHGFHYQTNINYRDIYIVEVWKLFRKIFQYNPKKNKVSVSKYFRNVRLHYMDVRDYFEGVYFESIFEANSISYNMINEQVVYPNDVEHLINILSRFKIYCEMILSVIQNYKKSNVNQEPKYVKLIKFNNKNNNPKLTENQERELFLQNITYIINKTFARINNDDVKNKLSKQLDVLENYLADLISDCEYLVNEFKAIIDVLRTDTNELRKSEGVIKEFLYGLPSNLILKFIFFIRENISNLSNKSTFAFTRFMDVYFLRRFLDKDYITNAIVYTGSHHSNVYIEILSRDFGFKVTHFSYSKITDPNKLNKQIKKLEATELGEIFYPSTRTQCSDLTHFPSNFL